MIELRGELLPGVGEPMAPTARVDGEGDERPGSSELPEPAVEGRVAQEPCQELEPGGGGEALNVGAPEWAGDGQGSEEGTGAEAPEGNNGLEKESTKAKSRPRSQRERMKTSLQEILDVEGAAKALGVSRRLVLRLLRDGELPGRKVGREWRILRSAIVQWLKEPESKEPTWLERAVEKGRVSVDRKGGLG